MNKEQLEKRKKTIYDFICDELYVPMKAKEIAMILSVPKEERESLREVLEILVSEGKIEISKKGKYVKAEKKYLSGTFTANQKGLLRWRGRKRIYLSLPRIPAVPFTWTR